MTIENIIKDLKLQAHPEGGYYHETYRSEETISIQNRTRNICTSIYYLLSEKDKSHFHRIQSDELWYFHQGEAIELNILREGKLISIFLGTNFEQGEVPYTFVPAGSWFAAKIKNSKNFALVSCVVSPGFDFADFEMANRSELVKLYPEHETCIVNFTRE